LAAGFLWAARTAGAVGARFHAPGAFCLEGVEKTVIPAKAGIQGFDFSRFYFWKTRFY
jgi:hypothetical protein